MTIQFYREIEPEEKTHQRGGRGAQNFTEAFNFQIKLNGRAALSR
jgi:hypothetical protein